MNWKPFVATAMLIVASIGAGAVAATTDSRSMDGAQAKAYSGTHVSFSTSGDAVTDYQVNGTQVIDAVAVQSKSTAESRSRAEGGVNVGVDLRSVTSFAAASLDVTATASTQATVKSESGATIRAHDNDRGVLVVDAGSKAQYVRVNLTSDAEAENAGQKRVVVTKADGTKAVVLVVGDGKVTVNDAGNVSARLNENARLVYRQYTGERSESEKQQERLITSGQATAEVYYQQAADGSGRVVDVVNYSSDTTVKTTEQSKQRLTMEVTRAESQGKVVIVSVSKAAMENVEDLSVTVDGKAAAKASTYSEIQSAANGGDRSAYLVKQSTSAQSSVDVVVGINHFSTRKMTISSDSTGDGSGDGSPTDGNGAGFGVAAALVALAGVALLARR